MQQDPSPVENTPSRRIEAFRETFQRIEEEVSRVVVGHRSTIRKVLTAFFAGGHVLMEGVPGLGKTLLVKSVSRALGLSFRRIQFTPDLMPSDIVGAPILSEAGGSREFRFRPGPIFANLVLADEINRASPKTQSAVLEAMEEHQVTVFGETHPLDEPFFLLATQNPIELEGTYPLPEAQLDRFLFKLPMDPPGAEDLKEILRRTTGGARTSVAPALSDTTVIDELKNLVRLVDVAPPLEDLVVELTLQASPHGTGAPEKVATYVRYGPGPRAAQSILLGAKVNALLDGRGHVAREDVVDAAPPALRHRLVLNFQAEADGVTADAVVSDVLESVDGS